jgi:hypothetical protein
MPRLTTEANRTTASEVTILATRRTDTTKAVTALARSLGIALLIAAVLGGLLLLEPHVPPSELPSARPRPARLDVPYRPGPSATAALGSNAQR